MVDTSIINLNSYVTVHPQDWLIVVDTTDTTMSPSGSDKRLQISTLLSSTTTNGILKGNGTTLSAAVSGTDYQPVIRLTTLGGAGAATFDGITLNVPQYTGAGGGGGGAGTVLTGLANQLAVFPVGGATVSGTNVNLVLTQTVKPLTVDTPGSVITMNLALGDYHQVTLGANSTIVFSNAVSGQPFTTKVQQSLSSGPFIPTYSGNITWFGTPGFVAPAFPSLASGIQKCTFWFTGSSYDGHFCGNSSL